jgi:spermidine/putrescine transport system ATP-binding protein
VTSAAVEVRSVVKRYGGQAALDTVSLSVAAGEYAVLLGPSGSGKTTLLSIIGGFIQPDSGSVLVGGSDMTRAPPAKRPTATVFQDYALFPHMSVAGNVGFGLRMRKVARAARDARVAEMLELVGLADSGAKKPHQLSGGQRQRIALARALAVSPSVLLLDEPLGALDLKLRRQMQEELKAIQTRVGTTFIHVTHDQEEAMAIADRIVVMNAGRIEDEGEPSRVYLSPRTRFAASFMGQGCFLEGEIARIEEVCIVVSTGPALLDLPKPSTRIYRTGERVVVSIRPEHFCVCEAAGAVALGRARIEALSFLGAHRIARLRHEEHPSFAPTLLLPQKADLKVGDVVPLWLPRESAVVLPMDE